MKMNDEIICVAMRCISDVVREAMQENECSAEELLAITEKTSDALIAGFNKLNTVI